MSRIAEAIPKADLEGEWASSNDDAAAEDQSRSVGKETVTIVEKQAVVEVEGLCPSTVVVTHVQIEIAVLVDVTDVHGAESGSVREAVGGIALELFHSCILVAESTPCASNEAKVHVDSGVGNVLGLAISQG